MEPGAQEVVYTALFVIIASLALLAIVLNIGSRIY